LRASGGLAGADWRHALSSWEADIISVREAVISFFRISGNDQLKTMTLIDGTIDRVTGSLMANVVVSPTTKDRTRIKVSYDLLCKPALQLF
jgi:hypothetical protein